MIFGCDPANVTYCDPRYDGYVNTAYAIMVILAFLISGSLNPVLFWFHCCHQPKIPIILFRILNVSDFATTTFLCPYLIYGLLSPSFMPHNVPATLWQRLYSALFAFILFISVSITTLMTATRVYAIKYPLKMMHKKHAIFYPLAGLICLALLIVSINFYCNATWDRYLYSTNRLKLVIIKDGKIDNWPELAFGGILMSIAVAGCVCAVITGKEVYQTWKNMQEMRHVSNERQQKNKSHITILLLSGGIEVAVLFVIAQFIYSIVVMSEFSYQANYFFYANGLFCSLVLSVVNPIITVSRSSGFKQFLAKKLVPATSSNTVVLNDNTIILCRQQTIYPRSRSSSIKLRRESSVSHRKRRSDA